MLTPFFVTPLSCLLPLPPPPYVVDPRWHSWCPVAPARGWELCVYGGWGFASAVLVYVTHSLRGSFFRHVVIAPMCHSVHVCLRSRESSVHWRCPISHAHVHVHTCASMSCVGSGSRAEAEAAEASTAAEAEVLAAAEEVAAEAKAQCVAAAQAAAAAAATADGRRPMHCHRTRRRKPS